MTRNIGATKQTEQGGAACPIKEIQRQRAGSNTPGTQSLGADFVEPTSKYFLLTQTRRDFENVPKPT